MTQIKTILAGLACLLLTSIAITLPAATLPAGFGEEKIADGLNPTTMAFAPDGRLFLCEKQGRVLVVADGSLLPTPMIDCSAKVDSWNERGLGGICLDPQFATNGYLYLYYTAKDPSHNRVSRFMVVGNTASPDSEHVLLDIDPLSSTGWHNGGGMCFGKDGKFYVATGENANGDNAQNPNNLLGKLLRLNPDGSIPTDNPNYQTYKGRHRSIVALGLRNPFALSTQPGTGLIYINNVGAQYEEIERYDSDVTPQAVNYGWPKIDGPRGRKFAQPAYREPAYAYDHGSGEGTALCGGNFFVFDARNKEGLPAKYQGHYFFADYRGWIKCIDPLMPSQRVDFATNIDRPIDVEFAPDGSMWYIARAGQGGGSDADNTSTSNGSLWRVRWTGEGGAAKLAFATEPTSSNVGGALSPAVRVEVQDAKGERVLGSDAVVTLSITGKENSATLQRTLTRKAINGIATFDNLRWDQPGRDFKLTCSSDGLKPEESAAFDVIAKVDTPVASPRSGEYTGPVWVQLASATPATRIRFTTDGSTPTANSDVYTRPFCVDDTTVVKAFAERAGLADSEVTTASLAITGDVPYGMDVRPEVAGVTVPLANGAGVPQTLSGTGLFRDTAKFDAKPGIVPYNVNSPLWSDSAEKTRWVHLPSRKQIELAEDGTYQWPGGTLFVKHFDLVVNEQTHDSRRLETRLLVLDETGINGYGVTYKWREDNLDADLLATGLDEEIEIVAADGSTRTQTWHYPSQEECLQCHTVKSGFVLGPSMRQLNGDFAYPGGRTDNQVRTWNYLQMFSQNIREDRIQDFEPLVRVDDASAPLEHRVRSYFDANCAFCHLPGGTGAQWDARYSTPLAHQNNVGSPVRETFGIADAMVVAPGDLKRSITHLRMMSTETARRMPPVGSNVVDRAAVDAVAQWIESLPTKTDTGIVSGQVYYLVAKHSNKRLEVPTDAIDRNAAGLQQWSPRSNSDGGDQNQQWRFDEIDDGIWRLTNIASGKVLDLPGGSKASSTRLQQYTDNGGDNQRWSITPAEEGFFAITSIASGQNVDVDAVSTRDGAEIHQYHDTGNDNQLWRIIPRP